MPPALGGFECLMFPLWRFLKGQERPVPSKAASAIVVPKCHSSCKRHPGLVPQRGGRREHEGLIPGWVFLNPDPGASPGMVSSAARGDLPSWGL